MFGPDVVLAPQEVKVSVEVDPVYNLLASLMILNNLPYRSGFDNWVQETAASMGASQRHTNQLIFWALGYHLLPQLHLTWQTWPDFPAFLDYLADEDPLHLRDGLLDILVTKPRKRHPQLTPPSPQALLGSVDTYLNYIESVLKLAEEKTEFDPALYREAHALLNRPQQLRTLIASHLQEMWYTWLAPEWARLSPTVEESVAAFRRLDYTGMSAYQAMQAVTGRDLRGIIGMDELAGVEHIVFTPSPHSGPYVAWTVIGKVMQLGYGMRFPADVSGGTAVLSHSELLMLLNALDDDIRLRILQLLLRHKEMCAPEIMAHFDLTQSTASRHLRQLSATELVVERRKGGAKKCYSLNRVRVADVLRTLERVLLED